MKTLSSSARAHWITGLFLFCPFLSMPVASSRRNRHLRPQSRCLSTTAARKLYLRVRTWAHRQSAGMAFFTLLFPLTFPLLLPLSVLDAWTCLLSSYLAALRMVFFPLLTSPPVFLTLLLRHSALPPGAVSRDGQRLDLSLSVKSNARECLGCIRYR